MVVLSISITWKEWNELTREIYDAVDQHLAQNHIQYFTDLSDAEKTLLLERAARSIASSDGGKEGFLFFNEKMKSIDFVERNCLWQLAIKALICVGSIG